MNFYLSMSTWRKAPFKTYYLVSNVFLFVATISFKLNVNQTTTHEVVILGVFAGLPEVKSSLNWLIRVQICRDVAKGLVFLHEKETKRQIIHSDIKPTNILQDKDFMRRYQILDMQSLMQRKILARSKYKRNNVRECFYIHDLFISSFLVKDKNN